MKSNPLGFWKMHQGEFPIISKVATGAEIPVPTTKQGRLRAGVQRDRVNNVTKEEPTASKKPGTAAVPKV